MKIYRLLLAIVITIGCMVSIGKYIGIDNVKSLLILFLITAVVLLKMIVGDPVGDGFQWYKHGYDTCVSTFGAVLTALAIQLTSEHDLFPGFANVPVIKLLSSLSKDLIIGRSIQLFALLCFSLLAMALTASIATAIKHDKTVPGKSFLAFLNAVIGTFVMGFHVLLLLKKG